MDAKEREIRLFVRADGSCPFEDWVRALRDKRSRERVHARIDRLRLGNFGDCGPVGGGVHELRVHRGPGLRVYFAPMGPSQVVLLCAGTKRTQEADILRARAYLGELKSDADKEL